MKAISIIQPHANRIVNGTKTIETRNWNTRYRGDLIIASSKVPQIEPAGCALAIVRLKDTHKMRWGEEVAACCPFKKTSYSWILDNVRPLRKPVPIKGKLGLYEIKGELLDRILAAILTPSGSGIQEIELFT